MNDHVNRNCDEEKIFFLSNSIHSIIIETQNKTNLHQMHQAPINHEIIRTFSSKRLNHFKKKAIFIVMCFEECLKFRFREQKYRKINKSK